MTSELVKGHGTTGIAADTVVAAAASVAGEPFVVVVVVAVAAAAAEPLTSAVEEAYDSHNTILK